MAPLSPMVLFAVAIPSTPPPDHDPVHTGLALVIVGSVIAAAAVTETIRHRRRLVPIPPRPAAGAPPERMHRDIANPTVLLAHRP